jgi:hypothetical protein
MAERTFRDSTGTSWRVWEVRPGGDLLRSAGASRRVGADRRLAPAPDPIVERRHGEERRLRARPGVAAVRPGFEDGWLVFQTVAPSSLTRRLAPVPPDWEHCGAPELERHCRRAAPARTLLAGGELRR